MTQDMPTQQVDTLYNKNLSNNSEWLTVKVILINKKPWTLQSMYNFGVYISPDKHQNEY